MAAGDIAYGVSGLLGGVESGVDFLRKLEEDRRRKEEELRKQRAEQLQMLLHGGQLLETYPEAGEGLAGLVPEPTLSKLRGAATQRGESLAKLYQSAGVEGATPDVARLLDKRGELVKPFIERAQQAKIGSLLGGLSQAANLEKQQDPTLTTYQATQRAIAKLPPEVRATVYGLSKDYFDRAGLTTSPEEERKTIFGQMVGQAGTLLDQGTIDPATAGRMIGIAAMRFKGSPMKFEEMETVLGPEFVAGLKGKEEFTKNYQAVQGKAAGEVAPLPGTKVTPQDIQIRGKRREAEATAFGKVIGEYRALTTEDKGRLIGEILQEMKRDPSVGGDLATIIRNAAAGGMPVDEQWDMLLEAARASKPIDEFLSSILSKTLGQQGIPVPPRLQPPGERQGLGRYIQPRGLPGRAPAATVPSAVFPGGTSEERERGGMPERPPVSTPRAILPPTGMPDPVANKGRTLRDTRTGQRYRSDGTTWQRIQ